MKRIKFHNFYNKVKFSWEIKVFLVIIICLIGSTLSGFFSAPKLDSDSTTIMNNIVKQLTLAIEDEDVDSIKEMFLPEKEIEDEKISQLFSLYRGTMISFERYNYGENRYSHSYSISNGWSKDYLDSFLVKTTESTYVLKVGWVAIPEKKSGLYYVSLRTEDSVVLP